MQTILITGAASGIGRAAVLRAAALGWRCVAVDRDAAGLRQLLQALPPCALGPHQAFMVDLLDADAIVQLEEQVPMLDALVNNAGMSSCSNQALVDIPAAQHERLLQLNLHAPAQLVQALQSRMQPGARVVNVASGAGLRAIPWRGFYSVSKAGLIAQTQALARAYPDWCVTVLSPGFVRTALVDSLLQSGRLRPESAQAKIPLGRMADPEELADAICFLATAAALPFSGQVLVVDGGSSVYGGSQPLPAATVQPVPYSLPTRWQVQGHADAELQLSALNPAADVPAYEACVDFSAWYGPCHQVIEQVLQAAQRFALQHASSASLLLVLARPSGAEHGVQTASHAAARMLVTTLACEWGSRGLRINAIEVDADAALPKLQPVLAYLCGARAQFVTGQTLVWRPEGQGYA